MQTAETTPPAAAIAPTRSRWVIGTLMVAAFVVILNETAMNVALSRIMADLSITERTAQWLTAAFLLTMAVVIPVTGWLLDRMSTRAAFALAMSLFTAGTAICVVAPSFPLLLSGRIVQASGTAIMMPLLMTTVMRLVPAERRGAVMGNISLVISAAPAIGPTMSGLILQIASWRGVFGIVLPIAIAMLVLGWRQLTDVSQQKRTPLDLPSIPLTVTGFGGLVYGLSLLGDPTIATWEVPVALTIGVVSLVIFGLRQWRLQQRDAALLDLRPFGYRSFSLALLVMGLAMMALFGTIILLPLLLQQAYGMSPLTVGLMLLPGALAMGLLSPVVGRLYDRYDPRRLVVPAAVVVGLVLAALSTLSLGTPWWFILACHMAMSICFAFIFTPMFTISLGSVPPRFYSHGSALVGTLQQVSGAAGTALFVTILAVQSSAARSTGASAAAALLDGAHWSFVGACAVWVIVIGVTVMLRKPPANVE